MEVFRQFGQQKMDFQDIAQIDIIVSIRARTPSEAYSRMESSDWTATCMQAGRRRQLLPNDLNENAVEDAVTTKHDCWESLLWLVVGSRIFIG